MKLLSGRRPQLRLAWLMVGIAIIGLVLGGVIWFRSAWPEIQTRHRTSADHAAHAHFWRQVAGWVDDPGLSARRYPNTPDESGRQWFDGRRPYVYSLLLYSYPKGEAAHEFVRRHRDEILALCRDRVAYHQRMRDRWSLAVWTPWSDPGPDEPQPPILAERVVSQSY